MTETLPAPTDRRVGRAMLRSLLPSLVWLAIAAAIYSLIPDVAWRLRPVVISVGVLGLTRYGWQLVNALRAYYFLHVVFPRIRARADRLERAHPRRIFFVVLSYHEDPAVSRLSFSSIVSECRELASEVVVLVSVGSAEERSEITRIVTSCPGHERIRLLFTFQEKGKRPAMGHALRAIAREAGPTTQDDIVVLMDGDTALCPKSLEKSLAIMKLMPDVGAVTTDNLALFVRRCSPLVEEWYHVRFIKRHHMMASHSLSGRVLTLTGRFSIFRAPIALTREFIEYLDEDAIEDWVHGRIRFLMGDDKSTMFCLLKYGWKMYYVPDAQVYTLENRAGAFTEVSRSLMRRWYGNMLRTNGRAIALGPGAMPFFIWLSFVNQRFTMWSTLTGPLSALILSFALGGYIGLMYATWVILLRLLQLWVMGVGHGHTLKVVDLLVHLWEEWYGSVLKVHSFFNLHQQSWQKDGTANRTAGATAADFPKLRSVLPRALLAFYTVTFILAVALLTGAVRLPSLL